jgi:ABC-type uncharacterized transport system permease subunit
MTVFEKKREATTDELATAFSGPAPGVNKFVITLGQTGLRVAFLEETNGSIYFRNAVTMHPLDGLKLRDLLKQMLGDIEAQLSAVREPNLDGE